MPVEPLSAQEQEWANAVYRELYWDFSDPSGAAVLTMETRDTPRSVQDQRSDTADQDSVVAVIPEKPSQFHTVLDEIGLPKTEDIRDHLQACLEKRSAMNKNFKEAALADPVAAKWQHHVKVTLNMSQDKADKMVMKSFLNTYEKDAQARTKEIFQTLSSDPRFPKFLQKVGNANPAELTSAHKETVLFLSENTKTLREDIDEKCRVLKDGYLLGQIVSENINSANGRAVTPTDKQNLKQMKQEVTAFQIASSRQLAMSLNAENNIINTDSFKDAIDDATVELSKKNQCCHNTLLGLNTVVEDLIEKNLAQSNNRSKTLHWVASQPWSKLFNVSIEDKGDCFGILTNVRTTLDAGDNPLEPSNINNANTPQIHLTIAKLSITPELIFNGLRSPEIMAAFTSMPTGEASADEVPVVEKPSDLAMASGEAFVKVAGEERDVSDLLPDYMTLKQVRYHDVKQGIFSNTDTVKTAWVIEQKNNSDTIVQVNLINNLARSIARDLEELALNLNDLKLYEAANTEEMQAGKNSLDHLINSKGDGLFQAFGTAHGALNSLHKHALKEVIAKMGKESNIKKVLKWAKEQSWAGMFEATITPQEGGKKDDYYVNVMEKGKGAAEKETVHLYEQTAEGNANAGSTVDNAEQTSDDQHHGTKGALKALLEPSVHKQMISKPTGESSNGVPVVETPSKLAKDWATLLIDSGAKSSLPDYLELRKVKYRSSSSLPWRKNKLLSCWVLEFKTEAFEQAA